MQTRRRPMLGCSHRCAGLGCPADQVDRPLLVYEGPLEKSTRLSGRGQKQRRGAQPPAAAVVSATARKTAPTRKQGSLASCMELPSSLQVPCTRLPLQGPPICVYAWPDIDIWREEPQRQARMVAGRLRRARRRFVRRPGTPLTVRMRSKTPQAIAKAVHLVISWTSPGAWSDLTSALVGCHRSGAWARVPRVEGL